MIERVARAIVSALMEQSGFGDRLPDDYIAHYAPAARAAIEAMREPTEAMVKANYTQPIHGGVDDGWRMMIDAALKE